ncbi:hypothetical protein [Patulibacter americanus]|uniref:hypothetical protein n=1 Tax=Patulibacter americanus TaxID=588672 RepID=UPI0003B473C6|nr:hypothetical protein [Patulibacter americanus]
MHPTRRSGVPAAALVLLAAGLGAAAPATAAGPPTWAGTTKAAFGGDSFVVGPVSDGRRLWTLELAAQHPALLRSRSIRTGRLVSSVRVEVPRNASATVVGQSEEAPAPQLVIGRNVGAVTGTWCDVEEDERGGGA